MLQFAVLQLVKPYPPTERNLSLGLYRAKQVQTDDAH